MRLFGPDAVPLALRCFAPTHAAPQCCIVSVHGLLGTARNWTTVATTLSTAPVTGDGVKLAPAVVRAHDLRNHGGSPHTDTMSLWDCANDLDAALVEARAAHPTLPIVVMGHSLGGMVVMYSLLRRNNRALVKHFTEDAPAPAHLAMPLAATVIVDQYPGPRPPSFYTMASWIRAMQRLPVAEIHSQNAAERWMQTQAGVADMWTAKYFASNVAVLPTGGVRWIPNLPVLVRALDKGTLLWEEQAPQMFRFASAPAPSPVPALFVFGGDSAYHNRDALHAVEEQFADHHVEVVPDAGHFVHVYQPRETAQRIATFLHRQGLLQPVS